MSYTLLSTINELHIALNYFGVQYKDAILPV